MKYYRRTYSSGARVKRIMFRILFVIISAAVITFGAIILGTYLQKKVEAAEALKNVSSPADELIVGRFKSPDSAASKRAVFASGISLAELENEEAVVESVNSVAEQYNTVLIKVSAEDMTEESFSNRLCYTSPALCSMLGIAVPNDDGKLTLLRSAISAAKSKKLYICAVVDTSYGKLEGELAAMVDGTLAGELSSFGADEILYTGAVTSAENIEANEIAEYIEGCKDLAGGRCELGIVIPDDVYLNFKNAKGIQTISSSADFTAIDMTFDFQNDAQADPSAVYSATSEDVTSLFGSFSVYNMRVLLSTPDRSILAAQYRALTDSNIMNICFTDRIDEFSLIFNASGRAVSDQSDIRPNTEKTEAPQTQTNPYAITSPLPDTSEDDSEAQP